MPPAQHQRSLRQSHTDSAQLTHDHGVDCSPSARQFTAIDILQQLDNETILAWLTGLRTFRPGSDHWFQPSKLKPQHLNAISSLKEWSDDLVLAWLDSARRTGTVASSPTTPGPDNVFDGQRGFSAPTALQGSPNPTSAGVSGPLPYIYHTSHNVIQHPLGQRSAYHVTPSTHTFGEANTSPLAPSGHPHGCPSCEKSRAISTCDGWKRHMKEHETIYICRACENGTPGKTKSYTRKANLAKHIAEYHKVSKLKAAALADTWRRKDGRRYYSCGFCVVLFHTIMEQLNHIDTDHFRHFQAVSDWDANKVIRGLLLQPEVNTILRKMLGTYYDAASEGLTWDLSITRSLQLRLELSEESAEDLSAAVANQGTWNVTTQGLVSTGLANDFSDHQMVHDLNLVPAQCDAIMPPVYTDLNAAPALTEMTATTQFLENGDFTPAFNLPDHVTTRSSYMCLGMPEPQIPLPDTSLDAGYHHASLVVRPAWQPSNTSNSVQPQHSSSPDWSQLQDRHSLGSMESSSMTDGSWSDAAFSASSNPTSRSHSSLLHYPSVSTANNAFGTEVSSPTSQPTVLSMDYAEDDTTDTESSLLSARIKKQRSRNKLRTYYEAPDLDIEELQRVMHDQDHTRSTWSQKRRR